MGNVLEALFLHIYHSAKTLLQLWDIKWSHLLWWRKNRLTAEQQKCVTSALKAAKCGDVETLRRLSEEKLSDHCVPLSEIVDGEGYTLLHVAMTKSSKECIQHLVLSGCSVTKGNKSKETPVHAACMTGNVDGLKALLEASVDVDLERKDMWGRTPLLKAMVYNRDKMVNFLLDLGADVNAQDKDGLSMVHLAVSHDCVDLLHRLHKHGADINCLNSRRCPPLHVAIALSIPHLVEDLLNFGASTASKYHLRPPILHAISKVLHSYENHSLLSTAERILHLMLAAHGLPIHSDQPDLFRGVIKKAVFLPLAQKMHICSDCPFENGLVRKISEEEAPTHSSRRGASSLMGHSSDGSALVRTPVSLFNLARRSARKSMMASGKNIIWAVGKLSGVPPAVKGILLLKDYEHKTPPVFLE